MRIHSQKLQARWRRSVCVVAVLLATFLGGHMPSVSAAAGDVVMMPDRDALMGTSVVVWGNTKHANGTAYSLDFGDGPPVVGVVADQSYMAFNHTYATAGVFTATLTILGDVDSVVIEVFDATALSPENLRNVRINMAIEDGLRYLYFSQNNRAATYATPYTSWTTHPDPHFFMSYSSLAILALENHGHTVLDDPTQDIFQPVVQRGLNFLFNNLQTIGLSVEPAGDPCVAVPAPVCTGLGRTGFHGGYSSGVITLAVAGSGAPLRVVGDMNGDGDTTDPGDVPGIGVANGGFVLGRTFAEILQRQTNAVMWGASDGAPYRGGWGYVLDSSQGDGSTEGWAVLALLDAEAAGATVPSWMRDEVDDFYLPNALNADGSLMYNIGGSNSNFPKTGIGLEVMAFANRPGTNPEVLGAQGLLSTFWPAGYTTDGFVGGNKGHAYGMFNAFKGLKLYGVQTLPGVGRAPGPGAIPANDWHADYQDFLVTTQVAPTTTGGGNWTMQWSYCGFCDLGGGQVGFTAIAELMLSPVALVLPANLTLEPLTDDNIVGDSHTVTATATSISGSFVAGATVTFEVTAGPNIGLTGTDVTDANGEATFTYTSALTGTDTIQASIGDLESNTVEKNWLPDNEAPVCSTATATGDLWPPNHKMVPIGIGGVTDPDGDPVTITITSIFQDEPTDGTGDGDTCPDASGVGGPVASVRAERTGNKKVPGDGRVYHIFFTATDSSNATCTGEVTVGVPHDQGGSSTPIDGGPLYNSGVCTP